MSREFAIVALIVGLVVIISGSIACTLTPYSTATPIPTPTPPTSTQVGEVELYRSASDGLLYKRESDGAIFEEISYSFSGVGYGKTEPIPARDGYICVSFKIDTDNFWEIKLHRPSVDPNTPGIYGTWLFREGFGSDVIRSCTPVYDGDAFGRSGQVDQYEGGAAVGDYTWIIRAASKANWKIDVCTKPKLEGIGCN